MPTTQHIRKITFLLWLLGFGIQSDRKHGEIAERERKQRERERERKQPAKTDRKQKEQS